MGIFNFLKGDSRTNTLGDNNDNTDIVSENGLNEIYYTNGTGLIKEKFFKKKGLIDGLVEEWYENGNIKRRLNYQDGVQVGKTYTYDRDGDLIREAEIRDDKYINEIIEYYKNGNYRCRILISQNNESDEYLLYNSTGVLQKRLFLIERPVNDPIVQGKMIPSLQFPDWKLNDEIRLIPDLKNPVWTTYNNKGNKITEIDFSIVIPKCWDDSIVQDYVEEGMNVCEFREYDEYGNLLFRKNKIIIQSDLKLFDHDIESIYQRRKNEDKDIEFITSDFVSDSLSEQSIFADILQLETFTRLHYLTVSIKEDALLEHEQLKEPRNWIRGFEILYQFSPTEKKYPNVPYYFEDGEEELPLALQELFLPFGSSSYTKSHVVMNTMNENDCMRLIQHIMMLNGGSESFSQYESDNSEFDHIYRNQIIRINKFQPNLEKMEIVEGHEIEVHYGGFIIDLLPPKNLASTYDTDPRGIHWHSDDINNVLLGLNKPIFCSLEGGVGDGRFAVVKDEDPSIILSHNEEFMIDDFKNIIRYFSEDNIILNMRDDEIKLLLDSSNLLSSDIEKECQLTGGTLNIKGIISKKDTVLCFMIQDKLMISMCKNHGRYSIRIDKLINSEWKNININKNDKFDFYIDETLSV